MKFSQLMLVFLPFLANSQIIHNSEINAGDTTQVHMLITKKGAKYLGTFMAMDDDVIHFKIKDKQTVDFLSKNVKTVKLQVSSLPDTIDGKIAVREHVFYFPTAKGLGKGKSEYRNINLYQNTFHHGLTDRLATGAGIVPTGFLNVAWIDAKLNFRLHDHLHFAVGSAIGGATWLKVDEENNNSATFYGLMAVLAIGQKRQLLNIGVVRLGSSTKGTDGILAASLAGYAPISRKSSIYCEMLLSSELAYLMPGVRVQFKNSCLEAGIGLFHKEIMFPLPNVSYAYRF